MKQETLSPLGLGISAPGDSFTRLNERLLALRKPHSGYKTFQQSSDACLSEKLYFSKELLWSLKSRECENVLYARSAAKACLTQTFETSLMLPRASLVDSQAYSLLLKGCLGQHSSVLCDRFP